MSENKYYCDEDGSGDDRQVRKTDSLDEERTEPRKKEERILTRY